MRGDQQSRLAERLSDRRIRDSGDAAHLRDHALCIGHVGFGVAADDLHVERRRQTEIQDLCRDIAGREGKVRARK